MQPLSFWGQLLPILSSTASRDLGARRQRATAAAIRGLQTANRDINPSLLAFFKRRYILNEASWPWESRRTPGYRSNRPGVGPTKGKATGFWVYSTSLCCKTLFCCFQLLYFACNVTSQKVRVARCPYNWRAGEPKKPTGVDSGCSEVKS